MGPAELAGIAWALVAAVFLGVFALPTKYTKDSAWENTWGAFFFIGMFVVPIVVALIAVRGLGGTYAKVSPGVMGAVVALGFMWGCGNICWGTGIAAIGMALGFSIMIGTVTLSGSLLPLFMSNADKAFTAPGMMILGGLLVCILGIAANGRAGLLREKAQTQEEPAEETPMLKGILICLAGGLLASGCNLAFHVGINVGKIPDISQEQFGNPPYLAGLAVWMLVFIGAGISTCGYCVFLLSRNKTWGQFANHTGRNLVLATLMAVSHFLCLFCYGLSAWKLGDLGTSVGIAIFEALSIVVANGLGVMTGEWKGAGGKSMKWMITGLAILILGIVLIAFGDARMKQAEKADATAMRAPSTMSYAVSR